MDKRLIAQRFAKARETYPEAARVQYQVAERMIAMLRLYAYTDGGSYPHSILEIGCGTGIYSRLLYRAFRPDRLMLNDLCSDMEQSLDDLTALPGVFFLPQDAENMPFPHDMGLITSCSTLQWFTAPEIFFARCHEALPPGGILAFTTFGPQNLNEIRSLTGNGLHYPAAHELLDMLHRQQFSTLWHEEEVVSLAFPTPLHVLKHLKQTGVTGTEKRMWTRSHLQRFCDDYVRFAARPDGGVTLTYHPLYFIVKKTTK